MAALVPSPQALAASRGRRALEYLLFFNSAIITVASTAASAEISTTFGPTDFPNPVRKVQRQQPFDPPNLLTTTLAPVQEEEVVVQTPFHQDDWSNPIQRAVRDYSYYQTHNEIPPVADVQGSVFPPFQASLPENILRPPWRDHTWVQSPFEIPQVPTTDAFGTPFTQTEHPNPLIHPDNKVSLLWFNSTILPKTDQTQGAFGTPFFQTEFPNPTLRGPFRDLTWTQEPQEIPQVIEAVAPATPISQFTWENPVVRKVGDFSWTQNLLESTLAPVAEVVSAEKPFHQDEWANPLRVRWLDGTWTQSPFEILQVIEAQVPFFPPEISNPVPRTVIRDFTWTHNDLNTVLAPVLIGEEDPFFQTDWPNPKTHPDTRVSLLWFNSAILPKSDQPEPNLGDEKPFLQTEWPNPVNKRPKWRDYTWFQTPFTITPSGPESADATTGRFVFREALVSPPIRRIKEREWGWVQGSDLALEVPTTPDPLPPFSLTDWPNPLRPWIRDLTWTQTPFTGLIPTVVPEPFPFSLTDWPNPKDLRPLFRDLTWTQTPPEITQSPVFVQNPFAQVEWPNPRSVRVQDVFIPQPYIETLIPVEVVVVPPTPEPPAATRPSGGHHPWFKKIKRRLQPWEIEEIQRVINEIALRQAQTLELDQQKRFEELSRELQLKEIEWDATYLEILNDEREKLIHEEIGRLLRKKLREEEEEIFLLLAASL